jgi:predicted transcriptional regulator
MAAIEPLIDVLPSEASCDELVAGAEAYPADAAVPDAVAGLVVDRLNRGARVSLTTPFFGAGFLRRIRRCHDDDTQITLIVAEEAIHRLVEAHHEVIRTICEKQGIDLRQATVPFEYGLWVVPDDHAGVIVLGDHGVAGALVNDSRDAISWASEQLERVSDRAVRVES